MAKPKKVMNARKLTQDEIDKAIDELLKEDEISKRSWKRVLELKALLETQYKLDPEQREIIQGKNFEMVKVPINNGRNTFSVDKLRPFLRKIGKTRMVIKSKRTVYVDQTALRELEEQGFIPREVIDNCREDKWTFKSEFRHIENANQAVIQAAATSTAANE